VSVRGADAGSPVAHWLCWSLWNKNNQMSKVCYLCGKDIPTDEKFSSDHVVPKLLIDREQPKVKGYDYGGFLPTHNNCNNAFGPESYCRKALKIISKLNDPECISKFQHNQHSDLLLMALNSECFDEFSEKELQFFKIRDVRSNSFDEIKDPAFIQQGQPTNIEEKVLFTSLAVISKSAGALLMKRHLNKVPTTWKILSIPYYGITKDLDFEIIIGESKPFDTDVKVYIKDMESDLFLVLYIAYGVMFYLFIQIDGGWRRLKDIAKKFQDAAPYFFKGKCINDLLSFKWRKINQ
jgi:hypothetical protein